MLKPLTGQNKSSKFNMFLFSFEGNDYDITLEQEKFQVGELTSNKRPRVELFYYL